MFKNLLVPLDGSQLAESVIPVVRRLVELCGCSVKLLHVIEKRPPSSIHGDTHLQDVRGAEKYLAAVSSRLEQLGIKASSHVHTVPQGDIPKCIAEHAEELDQDLIVLCTHGSSGVKRFVFGTNAEQVLTHGKTPVMLVKADLKGRPPRFGPNNIVALLENAPESALVLTGCGELAKISGAGLFLLYVVPTLSAMTPGEAPGGLLVPRTTRLLLDLETEQTLEKMHEQVKELIAEGIEADGTVRRGDVVSAVIGVAQKKEADLVALATRGLSGIGAMWEKDLVSGISGKFDGVLLVFPALKD